MKKYFIYILSAVFALSACETISVDDVSENPPTIESFSPMSAPAGAEIVVLGSNLNSVTAAYIGGQKVAISQKVSDARLSVRVAESVTRGVIRLENTAGSGESSQEFVCTYAVPQINAGLLQESAEMSSEMLICGENMNSVVEVKFTADGSDAAHVARIISRNESELVVRVPYVEAENARITLTYNDGSSIAETVLSEAPAIKVIRYVPEFDTYSFARTAVGKSVTLTGRHLDKVDRILVGGFPANLTKQQNSLSFTIPAGDFQDGETVTDVVAEYFDGYETQTLSDGFTVYVPFVRFWENITVSGHAKAGTLSCFFSPETGMVYSTADWRESLDPVAFKYTANTCSANQVPKVSAEEYDSVAPYFFFYSSNASVLSISSPANSSGLLKNFWIANVAGDQNRMPGLNGACYGTPVLAFRELKEGNSVEKTLIDAVLSQSLERIDEKSFPIDVTGQTIAGVSWSAPSGGLADSKWAPDAFGDKSADVKVKMDAVVMAVYYDSHGWDAAYSVNKLSNIRRIGFIHITQVDFKKDYANSSKPASMTDYTFNCYWQKYDYDYSKMN